MLLDDVLAEAPGKPKELIIGEMTPGYYGWRVDARAAWIADKGGAVPGGCEVGVWANASRVFSALKSLGATTTEHAHFLVTQDELNHVRAVHPELIWADITEVPDFLLCPDYVGLSERKYARAWFLRNRENGDALLIGVHGKRLNHITVRTFFKGPSGSLLTYLKEKGVPLAATKNVATGSEETLRSTTPFKKKDIIVPREEPGPLFSRDSPEVRGAIARGLDCVDGVFRKQGDEKKTAARLRHRTVWFVTTKNTTPGWLPLLEICANPGVQTSGFPAEAKRNGLLRVQRLILPVQMVRRPPGATRGCDRDLKE